MGHGQLGAVAHQIGRLFGAGTVAASTEWQLLHRYLDRRDEVAFGAIVARHGPMVLGVCRRTLGPGSPDVDDAFQATFLILARKAETLGEHDPIGHWLHGVARRVALRARSAAARRRLLERSAAPPGIAAPDDDGPGRREQAAMIDEELARLPRKYRAPVVLCYLEGSTHDEAARQLGWPVGTVKGRLARARAILKTRLARRGLAPAAVAALVAPAADAVATLAVPAALLESTIRITMASPAPGVVPAAVASLLAGSFATMFLSKMKAAGAILLTLGTGAAVLAYQGAKAPDDKTKANPNRAAQEMPAKVAPAPARPTEASTPLASWTTMPTEPPDDSPKTKAILAKLDERVSMNFSNDTPLDDIKKYIEQSTQDEKAGLPTGIPIYVDPKGMQEADKTMASTISISLEGVPLKTTLDLALKQLNLAYRVKDGLLIISSPARHNLASPLHLLLQKAERGELTRDQYNQLIEMLKLRDTVRSLADERSFQ